MAGIANVDTLHSLALRGLQSGEIQRTENKRGEIFRAERRDVASLTVPKKMSGDTLTY